MIESSSSISVPEDLYDQEYGDEIVEKVNTYLAKGHKHVVLDFKDCQSISSYGLSQLLKCSQIAAEKGARLSLKNVRIEMKEMFTVLLFNDVLKIDS